MTLNIIGSLGLFLVTAIRSDKYRFGALNSAIKAGNLKLTVGYAILLTLSHDLHNQTALQEQIGTLCVR